MSERRVCRVLGQHRSTQRKTPRGADDEAALTEDIIALARQYGRYGYRRIGVTEQSYYRWRKEYGGLKMDQARRMKELEKENARLRRAVSDLTLDKLILQEASRGNF